MKQKKTILLIAIALMVIIAGASVLYRQLGQGFTPEQLAPQQSAEGSAQENDPQADPDSSSPPQLPAAPDFTVYDEEGNEVMLSDFFGKPIVLNFWASWCGPCQMEMPHFQEKYLQLGDQVEFVMINSTDGGRETVDTAKQYLAEMEYTFPVYYDTQAHAAIAYGAYSMPMTFFINADGYVVARAAGPVDGETLQKGIDMITQVQE